jgi:hypothetical protein
MKAYSSSDSVSLGFDVGSRYIGLYSGFHCDTSHIYAGLQQVHGLGCSKSGTHAYRWVELNRLLVNPAPDAVRIYIQAACVTTPDFAI